MKILHLTQNISNYNSSDINHCFIEANKGHMNNHLSEIYSIMDIFKQYMEKEENGCNEIEEKKPVLYPFPNYNY